MVGGERLVILPVAKRCALVVERGKGPVKNFEGGEFLFFGSEGRTAREQQKENAKVRRESRSAAHANETYFPMPRLVTR